MNTRGPIMLVCVHMGTLAITPGLMGFLLDVTKYKSLIIINSYMWWWLLELLIAVTSKPSKICLLYTSPSPRDVEESRMPSSA